MREFGYQNWSRGDAEGLGAGYGMNWLGWARAGRRRPTASLVNSHAEARRPRRVLGGDVHVGVDVVGTSRTVPNLCELRASA